MATDKCPFCGTRVLWEWRRTWTPASTLLLLAGGYANVYTCWWAYYWAYQKALNTNVADLDATISSGRIIWVIVLLAVAVTVDVMAFRLLWDWRQVCPRCGSQDIQRLPHLLAKHADTGGPMARCLVCKHEFTL